ncbi:hypothetical protein [Conexibacter sp. CPCC 206217]|uniref:hypothetical protein n=1 Tax=Conexibacter sp. CPCC 206217 TaxID=3064574 RepID=UPI002721D2FF|nr:hypothetical protein [Conexibacter sp. CPCC 206217]MDO8213204.1 hypothetical protein [Conexibacter sp. CPCC 206217]
MKRRLLAVTVVAAAFAWGPASAGATTTRSVASSSCEVGAISMLVGDYNMSYERTTPICDRASTASIVVGGHEYFGPATPGYEEIGMRLSFGALAAALSPTDTVRSAQLVVFTEDGTEPDGLRAVVGDDYDGTFATAISLRARSSVTFDVTGIVADWQADRAAGLGPFYITQEAGSSLLIDGWTWGDNEFNACVINRTIGCPEGASTLSSTTNATSAQHPYLEVLSTP